MTSTGIHLASLREARPALRQLWASGKDIGSIHTLGALHVGHSAVIARAAEQNHFVVVTVYPNKAQLAAGTKYEYDLQRDCELAFASGATHVISSTDAEMYPDAYCTFLDQGERTARLDGTVIPFLFRGMITMCVRWINLVRPTRTYWGMKDIGQSLLLRRALEDMLVDTELVEVPCVRFASGVPVSSRLLRLPPQRLTEVAAIYRAIDAARARVAEGERNVARVLAELRAALPAQSFELCYAKLARAADFAEPDHVPDEPFVIHVAVRDQHIFHFDGMLIRDQDDLRRGPPAIWLEPSAANGS